MTRALVSISALLFGYFAAACSGGDESSTTGGSTVDGVTSDTATTQGLTSSTVSGTTGTPTSGATVTGSTSSSTSATTVTGSTATGTVTGTVTGTASTTSTSGVTSTTDGGVTTTGAGGASSTSDTASTATATTGSTVPEPTLVTSGEGAYWQVGEVTEGGGNATITVNEGQTYQTWSGLGGTFNEMGWDALKAVSDEDRALAMRLLFDKSDGIGFTYGRIPVGSSDYGLDRYSLNGTANDFEMTNFSIDRDRQDLIPYIHAALEVNPNIWFWASPWSPPPWMKDNNAFDKGNMKNDPDTLRAHALYLAKFVQEYATEGIIVKGVHPQNEPGYAQDYPSCLWSGSLMADYIANYMGPLFADELPDTEIWLGTMSNPNDSQIVSSVMGNSTARGYVKGIGLQWGMGDGDLPSTYASQYQIPVWQTEHKCGNYPWEGGTDQSKAPNDHAYAVESWGFFKNWIGKGVNAYNAWNMVLDTVGRSLDTVRPWAQNALIAVDRGQGKLVITPTYYVFRHLGQYVDPGAVRIGLQGGDGFAFKNPDGSIVTILYNSGGQPSNSTLSVAGTTLSFTIPGQGWATVNWPG